MKQLILIIFLLFISVVSAFSASTRDILSSIEDGVFGYDYKNETDIKRVERLEEYMYGAKKQGPLQNRVNALQNDSGIITERKKAKKSLPSINTKDTLMNEQTAKKPLLKEDSTVEYTIVDKMENDLFRRTYKNENIYDRLNRLEKTVFQQTSNEDLNSRVDKLASVIRPSSRKSDTQTVQTMDRGFDNGGIKPIDKNSLPFQLSILEGDILRKDYTGENNSNRLSRLEQKLFNRTFPNDADIQRLQRVIVAYEAKKDTYKYENNRKMQNMATISQIGGILLMILAILL